MKLTRVVMSLIIIKTWVGACGKKARATRLNQFVELKIDCMNTKFGKTSVCHQLTINSFVFYSPGLTPCLDDAGPQEIEPVCRQETPADVDDQLKKAGFPEAEGDLSPAALVPKTSVCVENTCPNLQP